MEMKHTKEVTEFLTRQFGLEPKSQLPTTDHYEWLHNELYLRLENLIRYRMEFLIHALYRIDVDESVSDRCFAQGEVKKVACSLATVIIERQIKKLEYRREQQ